MQRLPHLSYLKGFGLHLAHDLCHRNVVHELETRQFVTENDPNHNFTKHNPLIFIMTFLKQQNFPNGLSSCTIFNGVSEMKPIYTDGIFIQCSKQLLNKTVVPFFNQLYPTNFAHCISKTHPTRLSTFKRMVPTWCLSIKMLL